MRRCSGGWFGCLLLPFVLCSAPRATLADEQKRLTVNWQAPAGCPTAVRLRANIDRLLGSSADELLSEPLNVDASVTQSDPEHFGLTLQIGPQSRGGERKLVSSSCAELANAAAIIVALSIDPKLAISDTELYPGSEDNARAATPQGSPTRVPLPQGTPASGSARLRPESPVPPPTLAPRALAPRALAPRSLAPRALAPRTLAPRAEHDGARGSGVAARIRGRGFGTLTFGALPRPAAGGVLGAGLSLEDTSLWAYGGLLGWQEKRLDSYGGEFRLLATGVALCQALSEGKLWVAPCAALELHWLRGKGLMLSEAQSARRTIVEWGGGLEVGYALLSRWSVVAQGLLLVPSDRPRFVVDDRGSVYSVAEYGGRVGLGLEFRFWP